VSDPLAFDDALFITTKAMSNVWSTNNYLEADLAPAVPDGLTPSSVSVDIDFADSASGGGEIACFWLEVRRRSTGAVLATRGSPSAPHACEVTQTVQQTSTPLPEIDTAAKANDLQVRMYVQNSSNGKTMRLHRLVVQFNRYGRAWTLHRTTFADAVNGVRAESAWPVYAAGDGHELLTAGNWSNAFAANRFVAATFAASVPAGATVTGATLRHAYRSATSTDTTCWYAEAWHAGSLIGTYGSAAAPLDCSTGSSSQSSTVSLPEVNTGARANDLTIRIYGRNSGGRRSLHDHLQLDVAWSLPDSGCVDPGSQTLIPSADTWADQNAPTSTGGAADAELRIKSQNGSRNRRAYLRFPLPSDGPAGCSLQSATLRLTSSSTQGTRTIEVLRAASAWAEATLNWNNQPGATGAAATTPNASGLVTVDVTPQVGSLIAGPDHGLVIRDSAEDSATAAENRYRSREHAARPELILVWG
jgi:hypothetical protein